MEKVKLSENGFEGVFYNKGVTGKKAIILTMIFDGGGYFCKKLAKWLNLNNVAAIGLTMYGKKGMRHGQERMPLEYVQKAVKWLKHKGYNQIGVMGLSFGATYALSAAARISDISLVISLSGYEIVFEGTDHSGMSEWPAGHSAYTWKGKELAYQPYYLDKDSFMKTYYSTKKTLGEPTGRAVFDHSLQHEIPKEAYIPIWNIQGRIVLIGCLPDTEWDTCAAAERMSKSLEEHRFQYHVDKIIYEHGNHLTLPEVIPGIGILSRTKIEGRRYPKECKAVRVDIKNKIEAILNEW